MRQCKTNHVMARIICVNSVYVSMLWRAHVRQRRSHHVIARMYASVLNEACYGEDNMRPRSSKHVMARLYASEQNEACYDEDICVSAELSMLWRGYIRQCRTKHVMVRIHASVQNMFKCTSINVYIVLILYASV